MSTAATEHITGIHSENEYELIFRTYYKSLCSYAAVMLKDLDSAEETVQGVFVKLWEKRHQLSLEISVKAYLYKAVYHAALNEIKHRKVKQNYSQMELRNEQVVNPTSSSRSLKELETKIENALQKLPEQCRLIFRMSRFEELKYREIADVLNISVKTVENQMGKALRMMRENLADYLTLFFILFNYFNQ